MKKSNFYNHRPGPAFSSASIEGLTVERYSKVESRLEQYQRLNDPGMKARIEQERKELMRGRNNGRKKAD